MYGAVLGHHKDMDLFQLDENQQHQTWMNLNVLDCKFMHFRGRARGGGK